MAEGTPGPSSQCHNVLGRTRALLPLIEAASFATESEAALSPALLDALHGARLFRMLLPSSVGGLELEPAAFMEVLELLAGADASTAWVVAQGCGCSLSAAYLAPEAAREIFAPADAVLAWGPSGAGATAAVVEGGYRATGRWHFASGNRHAQWLGGHCTVVELDGKPLLDATGRPLERTLIFPRGDADVEDAWDVLGLKGTASYSYSVRDLFVPAARTYRRESPEDRRDPGPLYRFTGMNIFAFGIAAMAQGLARKLLDSFIAVARTKIDRVTGRPLKESGAVQAEVARSQARLAASRLLLLTTARELHEVLATGQSLTLEQRAQMRLCTVWAVSEARAVAGYAYTAAGASAIFASAPFERRFRDMHTLTQQVQAHSANFELVGQALLGMPPTSRLM